MLSLRLALRRARPPLQTVRGLASSSIARSRPPRPDMAAPSATPAAADTFASASSSSSSQHPFSLPDEKRAGPHSRTGAEDEAQANTKPVPRVRDPVRGPSGPVDLGEAAAAENVPPATSAAGSSPSVPETGPFSRPHFENAPGLSTPTPGAQEAADAAAADSAAAAKAAEAATLESAEASAAAAADTVAAAADLLPAVPDAQYHHRVPRHPFNTHLFVSTLERASVPAPNSRVLMEGVRGLITARTQRAVDTQLSVEEMDNNAYLFKAALSELRTEMSTRARNDGLKLRAVANAIRREVDGLDQTIKESVLQMKHDIEIDMNNRKAETTAELKRFDIAVEEINNKFTISLGELRTDIESSKWDATRRAIAVIITLVMFGVVMSTVTMGAAKEETEKEEKEKAEKAAAMKDVAVGPGPEEHHDLDPVYEHPSHVDPALSSRVDQLLMDRAVLDRDILAGKALAKKEKEKEKGRI